MSSIESIPKGSPNPSYDLTSDPNFMHILSNMIAQTLQCLHSNIVRPRTINMQSTFQIPQFPQPSVCNHPHCSPNFCQKNPSLPKPHKKKSMIKTEEE